MMIGRINPSTDADTLLVTCTLLGVRTRTLNPHIVSRFGVLLRCMTRHRQRGYVSSPHTTLSFLVVLSSFSRARLPLLRRCWAHHDSRVITSPFGPIILVWPLVCTDYIGAMNACHVSPSISTSVTTTTAAPCRCQVLPHLYPVSLLVSPESQTQSHVVSTADGWRGEIRCDKCLFVGSRRSVSSSVDGTWTVSVLLVCVGTSIYMHVLR